MALIELNGYGVLEATIVLSLRGNWRAELVASTDEADVTGTAELVDDDLLYVGTVTRGGLDHERWRGTIVGGAGKLDGPCLPRAYRETTAGIVLADLLAEVGERLSPTSDPTVLAYVLPQWFRFGNVEDAIEELVVDKIGANWRVQRDGAIWFGVDTFENVEPDVVIEDQDDQRKKWVVAADTTFFSPGVVFQGRQVVEVTHRITEAGLRSELSLG